MLNSEGSDLCFLANWATTGGDLFSNHESRIENLESPEWDPCSGELGYEWEYQWPMMNDQGGGSSGDFALPRIGIGTFNVQQSRVGGDPCSGELGYEDGKLSVGFRSVVGSFPRRTFLSLRSVESPDVVSYSCEGWEGIRVLTNSATRGISSKIRNREWRIRNRRHGIRVLANVATGGGQAVSSGVLAFLPTGGGLVGLGFDALP